MLQTYMNTLVYIMQVIHHAFIVYYACFCLLCTVSADNALFSPDLSPLYQQLPVASVLILRVMDSLFGE